MRPSRATVEKWFADDAPMRNYAVVTGTLLPDGRHLAVVDVDLYRDEHLKWWIEGFLYDSTCMVKTGGGGQHHFYATTERVASQPHLGGLAVDLKGGGGYVIGSGSRHASGQLYGPLDAWPDPQDLPALPEGIKAKPAPLRVKGEKREEPDAVKSQPLTCKPGSPEALRRATSYVQTVEPRNKGERDTTLHRIAFMMLHGCGASLDDAMPLLFEWGSRCTPPMKPRRITTTAKSAASEAAAESWEGWADHAHPAKDHAVPKERSSPARGDGFFRLVHKFLKREPGGIEKNTKNRLVRFLRCCNKAVKGESFYLGCRDVGSHTDVKYRYAARLLKWATAAGWIRRMEEYTEEKREAGLAILYRFVREEVAKKWNDEQECEGVADKGNEIEGVAAFSASPEGWRRGPPGQDGAGFVIDRRAAGELCP